MTRTVIISVIVMTLLLAVLWVFLKPKEEVYQGRVEAREVYLSAKIPSRLKTLEVKEGTSVQRGQLLVTLESPEIDAKEQQAAAARDAAMALKSKALKGARDEEINTAKSVYEKAKAASEVMLKTYKRIETLYKDGVVSEQQRDEIFAKKEAALRDEQVAHNRYIISTKATRSEDLAAARANEARAKSAWEEVLVYQGERKIVSNIDGEVLEFLPEEGELIGAGFPVVHLVDLQDAHAVLNIKETLLHKFKKGEEFTATVPALGNKKLTFKIYYISALGDFATWNATKTTGEFDVRTFEIKAQPLEDEHGLRPGMSVLVDGKQFAN